MDAKDGELRVFIVAGEVSGDSMASRFMASLKNLSPFPVRFAGVGGHKMSSEGLKSLFPMEDISVMGIWELLPYLYTIRVKLKETVEAAAKFDPHVVLTVDSKGFSFRFLKQLRARCNQKKLPSPVHFHYVAPSFWAWKGGESRLPGLAEFVDHLLCILPNEAEICRLNGLAATFVGHPVIEDVLEFTSRNKSSALELKVEGNAEDFRSKHAVPSGATVISVLPGSRVQEVTRMLPIFANTVELLKETFPQLMTVVHVASNQDVENYIATVVHKWPVPVILIPGGSTNLKYDAFTVLLPIGFGIEEMEVVILVDVLRRASAEVTVASVEPQLEVEAAGGIKLVADTDILTCSEEIFDLVALPGGMLGSVRLRDCEVLRKINCKQAEEKRLYDAICAAPAVTLLPWGLLRKKKSTCHPAFMDKLPTFWAVKSNIQVSGELTTSRGPGTTFQFALSLVEQLFRESAAKEVGELLCII
ncbi:hypothetical protein QN277_026086 [Acacia crassicarpa]|uniref:lipid-A-disaccharide synthase n=1 Tax=Acacia crassicarpa TaxID=499986 RepID=A0AAE1J764_9FABA|nr:hypothetical protein QN277_026086 [Acacia crassicarpa]